MEFAQFKEYNMRNMPQFRKLNGYQNETKDFSTYHQWLFTNDDQVLLTKYIAIKVDIVIINSRVVHVVMSVVNQQ